MILYDNLFTSEEHIFYLSNMYEEEFAAGSIYKGKKATEIDNDGPVSKKDKKNKMKK